MNIIQYNADLVLQILIYLDYESIINFGQVDKNVQNMYNGEHIWKILSKQKYNIKLDNPNKCTYLKLYTQNGGIWKGSEKYINFNEFARRCIVDNNMKLLVYILDMGYINYEYIMLKLSQKGYYDLAMGYLKHDSEYQAVAEGLCLGNDLNQLQYHIKKYKNLYKFNYQRLAQLSLYNKNTNFYTFFSNMKIKIPDFNELLYHAIINKNIKVIKLLLQSQQEILINILVKFVHLAYSVNDQPIINLFTSLFPHAIHINYSKIVFYCLKIYKKFNLEAFDKCSNYINFNKLLKLLIGINKDLFLKIYNILPKDYEINWLIIAGESFKTNNFDLILDLAKSTENWNWNYILHASFFGDMYQLNRVFKLAPQNYNWTWSYILDSAIKSHNKYIYTSIKNLIPPNYPIDWNLIHQLNPRLLQA